MATWKRILVEDDVIGDGIITVTGNVPHTVRLGDPSGLPQLTSPVTGTDPDKFLIWDDSEAEWKWIEAGDFPHPPEIHLGNSDLVQTDSTRTFDIFDGGIIKFIGNDGAGWKFEGQDTSGTHTLSIDMSYSVDTLSDSNYTMQGLRVSGYSDGQPPKKTGIWIEGSSQGTYAPLIQESQATLTFERGFSSLSPGTYDLGSIDFMGPYLIGTTPVDGSGSEFYDGEGKLFAKIVGGAEIGNQNIGYISLDIEVESYAANGTDTHVLTQMIGVVQDGVYINSNDTRDSNGDLLLNKYRLAPNRGENLQVLHTDGNGLTYWADNIPSTFYNSSYEFIEADLTTGLNYINVNQAYVFYPFQLQLPDNADGVVTVEGNNIGVDSYAATDVVEFTGLPEQASTFTFTVSGELEWISYVNCTINIRGEAVKYDASNNSSYITTYATYALGQNVYISATNGGTAPIGGATYPFTVTLPAIGTVQANPAVKAAFKFYIQHVGGTLNQSYYRFKNLSITLNN